MLFLTTYIVTVSIIYLRNNMAEKKQTDTKTTINRDINEIKLSLAILEKQVKNLQEIINAVIPQPMYTEEELHEIAEYRRKK